MFRDVGDVRQIRDSALLAVQATMDALDEDIAVFDQCGELCAANARWMDAFRLPVGGELNKLPRPRERANLSRVGSELAKFLAAELPSRAVIYSLQAGGAMTWHELRFGRLTVDAGRLIVARHQDVTEAIKGREALRQESERQLAIQRDERQRIAIELHDSTGQHLVAASLALTKLATISDRSAESENALADARNSIREAQREIRTLSYLLHPPGLDRNGLARTISNFAEGFARRANVGVQVQMRSVARRGATPIDQTLYRVVQEALVNVHRHAAAKAVRIVLVGTTRGIRVRITDNGRGMAKTMRRTASLDDFGVGIPGMRERIEGLGGRLEIDTGDWGTSICATIPFASSAIFAPLEGEDHLRAAG